MAEHYPHLKLIRKDIGFDRKKRTPYFLAAPKRGGRTKFAPELKTAFEKVRSEQSGVANSHGIKPHLLVRIPLAEGVQADALMQILSIAGMTTVAMDGREALVAFKEASDLTDFYKALAKYARGPKRKANGDLAKSTKWDVLEYIEAAQVRGYAAKDRLGPNFFQYAGEDLSLLPADYEGTVDIELWHLGEDSANKSAVQEIAEILRKDASKVKVLDTFLGESSVLLKARVNKGTLQTILAMAVVAEVELPPQPILQRHEVYELGVVDLPPSAAPPADAPGVCIIDSGINSNHPLLMNHIGHAEAVLTSTPSATDSHGHGTQVAGIVLYGDVRHCILNRKFASTIKLFSARVLNDKNEFDDESLIQKQIYSAIYKFSRDPYNCKVFNISIGSRSPSQAFSQARKRQTIWAETLDQAARNLGVLIIVSAGNVNLETFNSEDADLLRSGYPKHFDREEFGLSDPATAALALTVGSVAQHDVPAQTSGNSVNDITLPIAKTLQPSPFTRRGPGVSKSLKPDFVDFGGNLVFAGVHQTRRIVSEEGTAVISLAKSATGPLFTKTYGTSFAAPLVARKAALLQQKLKADFGVDPHPNLLRAILACNSDVPATCDEILLDRSKKLSLVGNGIVNLESCLSSDSGSVLMFYEGEMEIDKFSVFEIPVPEELQKIKGAKIFTVSLAFDPPVRRRRSDYLGVEMQFDLLRSLSLEQVLSKFKKSGDSDEGPKIKSSCKPALSPKKTKTFDRGKSTLQKGVLVAKKLTQAHGDTFFLVVRSVRKWAPSDVTHQNFAVAVSIQAQTDQLYNLVRQRIQPRVRARS